MLWRVVPGGHGPIDGLGIVAVGRSENMLRSPNSTTTALDVGLVNC